jgi:hypothetical protein
MRLFKISVVAVCTALALSARGASAAPMDLFQFDTTSNTESVVFNNPDLDGVAIPISVTFLDPNNSYGSTPTNATLTFHATADNTAGIVFGFVNVDSVSDVSFSVTADTPVGGLTNILSSSGSGITGTFVGTDSGFTLSGQSPGDNVAFTSDFFDVSTLTGDSFSIATGSPDPSATVNDGEISSFDATLAPGSFSASVVPEPSSLSLLAVAGIARLSRRRRHA